MGIRQSLVKTPVGGRLRSFNFTKADRGCLLRKCILSGCNEINFYKNYFIPWAVWAGCCKAKVPGVGVWCLTVVVSGSISIPGETALREGLDSPVPKESLTSLPDVLHWRLRPERSMKKDMKREILWFQQVNII